MPRTRNGSKPTSSSSVSSRTSRKRTATSASSVSTRTLRKTAQAKTVPHVDVTGDPDRYEEWEAHDLRSQLLRRERELNEATGLLKELRNAIQLVSRADMDRLGTKLDLCHRTIVFIQTQDPTYKGW